MRVFMINSVCGVGSTGRIVTDLCDILKKEGNQVKVAYGIGEASRIAIEDTVRINNKAGYYIHNTISRLTDRAGFFSFRATRKLISEIKRFDPDLIHLHNLHGYYLNIRGLFEFLKNAGIPVIWTLHDCWAMTGHCAHFSYIHCEKWKDKCHHCPQKNAYPKSYGIDRSARNYQEKRELFTAVPNMTLVTPSNWLADVVKESYLNKYEVYVIPNGIDINIFNRKNSNFKEVNNMVEKKMVLAVSNVWIEKKGMSDIYKLSQMLDTERYQVVMVGLTSEQIAAVPETVLPVQRTASIEELVKLYSAADVFINPSYEETMGLVTAEAMACGTPCVVYNQTAVPEAVAETGGIVVRAGDVEAMCKAVKEIGEKEWNPRTSASRYDLKLIKEAWMRLYICKGARTDEYKTTQK